MDQLEREVEERSRFLREIAGETGDSFFRGLALGICKATEAEGFILCEFAGGAGTKVHTVAACMRGELINNFRFDLPRSLWECEATTQPPIRNSQIRGLLPL